MVAHLYANPAAVPPLSDKPDMIYLEPDVYVRVHEFTGERAPQPRPLASGFQHGRAYRVLGLHVPSETSECYLILCNDRDEMWFVSNRHFQIVSVGQADGAAQKRLRFNLADMKVQALRPGVGAQG